MKKDISKLRHHYFLKFQLCLILVLSLVVLAFDYTYKQDIDYYLDLPEGIDYDDLYSCCCVGSYPPPPPPPIAVFYQIEEELAEDLEHIEEELLNLNIPLEDKEDFEILLPDLIKDSEEEEVWEFNIDVPLSEALEEEMEFFDFFDTEEDFPILEEEIEPVQTIEEVFAVVEEMPRFPGCEENDMMSIKEKQHCAERKMLDFIYKNIRYPPITRSTDVEGTIIIQFVINKNGEVTNPIILRDIGGGLGEEALRVVKMMPKWTPGKQLNKTVNVRYNVPIRIQLL